MWWVRGWVFMCVYLCMYGMHVLLDVFQALILKGHDLALHDVELLLAGTG